MCAAGSEAPVFEANSLWIVYIEIFRLPISKNLWILVYRKQFFLHIENT